MSAKASDFDKYHRFTTHNLLAAARQSRSNADMLSIDKQSYKMWQPHQDQSHDDEEEFGSADQSLDH